MVTKELKVKSEIVDELQRLAIEVDSRKSLIAFMIDTDMDISSERFQEYEREYQKYFFEYDLRKNEFEKDVIIPEFAPHKVLKWNLDFATEVAIVEIED